MTTRTYTRCNVGCSSDLSGTSRLNSTVDSVLHRSPFRLRHNGTQGSNSCQFSHSNAPRETRGRHQIIDLGMLSTAHTIAQKRRDILNKAIVDFVFLDARASSDTVGNRQRFSEPWGIDQGAISNYESHQSLTIHCVVRRRLDG